MKEFRLLIVGTCNLISYTCNDIHSTIDTHFLPKISGLKFGQKKLNFRRLF